METNANTRLSKKQTPRKERKKVTAPEQRIQQIYDAVPKSEKHTFLKMMEVICQSYGWQKDARPALQLVSFSANNVVDASERFSRPSGVNEIRLFGSQKLVRDGDTPSWLFTSNSTNPERLTERESMFINAALRAAGGQ